MNHKLLSSLLFVIFFIIVLVINFYLQTIPSPTVEEMLENNFNGKVALQQDGFEFGVLEPLQAASIFLGIVFFILIFVSKELFNTWKKFAFIYIPIGFILILLAPIQTSGLGISLTPDRVTVTKLVGYGLLVMSVLVILFKKIIIIKQLKK